MWLVKGLFSCGKGGEESKFDTTATIMDYKGTTQIHTICMVIRIRTNYVMITSPLSICM
jgi:hypothetical protein